MPSLPSRRQILAGIGAVPLVAASPAVWAEAAAADNALAPLRAAKSIVVGMANFPPYSSVNPDGTVTGVVPAMAKVVLHRLGMPDMTGVTATYGELIPGMMAGRWEFICTAMTITRARCAQVLFADPIVFDGPSFVSLKGELKSPPKLVSELVAQKLVVGVSAGGANARIALAAGVAPADLKQFPDNVALIQGLVAKRIQIVFQDNAGIRQVYRQRRLAVDVAFPIADAPEHGSSCAFRKGDGAFHDAFQKELRAMKASGEFLSILRTFGFDASPDQLAITAEKACATSV